MRLATLVVALGAIVPSIVSAEEKPIRVGIIGLDTSHAIAFTKELNAKDAKEDVAGCRVVAIYPKGSPDIESSTSRVPGYLKEIEALGGIEIVDSIDELLKRVDCILLETNDGRPHLEQALPVIKAKKPMFIDKPVAGNLADAVAIYRAAKESGSPVWSASSLRYVKGAQDIRGGAIGAVLGCDAYSPAPTEKTHPDLFWYGIHGVETLFTVMGSGCESVVRVTSPDMDVVTGRWKTPLAKDEIRSGPSTAAPGPRIGTFRGIRKGKASYGGTAFGEKDIREIGPFGGYRPLVVEIVKFFKGGEVPVSAEETLEIYAFMQAAQESKAKGGVEVKIADVMNAAQEEATERLKELANK
jgi:hypothetical protein